MGVSRRQSTNDLYAWTGAYNVSRSYQTNGLNQYQQTLTGGTPSATFLYDGNCNLTSDGITTFAYDVESRNPDSYQFPADSRRLRRYRRRSINPGAHAVPRRQRPQRP